MNINNISFKNNIYNQIDSSKRLNTLATPPINSAPIAKTKTKNDKKNQVLKYLGYASAGVALIIFAFKGKSIIKSISKLFSHNSNHQPNILENPTAIENISQNAEEIKPEEKPLFEIVNNGCYTYYKSLDTKNANKKLYVSEFYNLAKVNVPDKAGFSNYSSYQPDSFQNLYIENLQKIPQKFDFYKKIQHDFSIDALVSNKDVLESCRIDKNNKIYHIKFNNTLCTKPDGEPEHFGMVVDELASFFNPKANEQNAKLYSSMTREDLINSLKRVNQIDKTKAEKIYALSEYLENLNGLKYKDIMRKRISFLKQSLKIAQETPQENLSIEEYTEKIKNLTIEYCIKTTNKYSSINDLRYSVEHFDNQNLKEKYLKMINVRIKDLTSNPKVLSEYQAGEILKPYTYKSHKVSEDFQKVTEAEFGKEAAKYYINKIESPLKDLQIEAFTKIANLKNGKYLEFCKKYPERMVAFLNAKTLKDNQLEKFGDDEWNIIMKSYTSIFDNPQKIEYLDALRSYKGMSGYDQINGILRANFAIDNISKMISDKGKVGNINILKSNINGLKGITNKFYLCCSDGLRDSLQEARDNEKKINTTLDNILKMMTNESETLTPEIMLNIKTEFKNLKTTINEIGKETGFTKKIDLMENNFMTAGEDEKGISLGRNASTSDFSFFEPLGQNISKLMSDDTKTDYVLKYFNKRNPEIYYPSFMSTSIKPYDVMTGKVKWHLKLNDGVKYMYIEDLPNVFNSFGYSDQSEAELLVLPGQRIKILSASYIDNKYHIHGEIMPAKENLK